MNNNFYGPHRHKYFTREIPRLELVRNNENYFQVEENIHVIKKFLSEEECNFFMKIVDESNEDRWKSDKERGWWDKRVLFFNEKEKQDGILTNIVFKLNQFIKDDANLHMRDGLTAIHRLRPNEDMFVHCDNPVDEPYEINDEHRNHVNLGLQYAIVIYLNDFDGGELIYPNLNLKYKPEKGDAVWHPGIGKYSHGVLPVNGNKNRYITTTYITDEDVRIKNDILLGWDKK